MRDERKHTISISHGQALKGSTLRGIRCHAPSENSMTNVEFPPVEREDGREGGREGGGERIEKEESSFPRLSAGR